MEDWKYHKTYSGTPQGGIISPLLANIYLHELDKFVMKLKSEFDTHGQEPVRTEYRLLSNEIQKLSYHIGRSTGAEKERLLEEYKRKQFDVLRTLMRREDVTEVVNACDAGREGELIFRTAYCLAGCSKPMRRLWISSMEDDAIAEGFAHLKPGQDYDGLHQSALCRARADWLVGINATRYFSLLYGRTLNIGRVMSPTLALLVQREAEIAAFQAEPFSTVQLDCGFSAASERMKDRKTADAISVSCKGGTATVKSVERKEKSDKAPAL